MNSYKEFSKQLSELFQENSMFLCELDAAAGDGDHGITISRGFSKAWERVEKMSEEATASEVFKEIGYGMLESMGGASGPIFSMFFISMATVLRENEKFDGVNIKLGIEETVQGIFDLAGTKRNEKTMADALYGALDAVDGKSELGEFLAALEEGAKAGSESTMGMLATKGRAKFMGERSRDFKDAGSHSVYLIMKTMREIFA